MKEHDLLDLMNLVAERRVSPREAMRRLASLPFEDLHFAKVDHHREIRRGHPEVVYGKGKTDRQIVEIVKRLHASSRQNVMVTRASRSAYRLVKKMLPAARYSSEASMIYLRRDSGLHGSGSIAVVSAGTSDIPVAEEAYLTAWLLGNEVHKIYDVGVAGIHRLMSHVAVLRTARVVIAVAGMEGALPSVVSGLVAAPVIAVPTSTGYGASFGGIAALLAMLNSCSSGVGVVNIDNGFGAGYLASLINRNAEQA